MNSNKFFTFMNALDDDLLEEAKEPVRKKKTYFYWIPIAACFALFLILPLFENTHHYTAVELHALGYPMDLPVAAKHITYCLVKKDNTEVAQANFQLNGTSYTYEVSKSDTPVAFESDIDADDAVISWCSNGLDLCMIQSGDSTSLNWYSTEENTQHTLYCSANSDTLLTAAREVLLLTGLDLANAPKGAENIQYRVFDYNDIVVAETIFSYNNITCSYRMAATAEASEDFKDISDTHWESESPIPADVSYCRAKIYLGTNGEGKIIWFDIVPGVVYSLSLDSNATEELLKNLADELFHPLQGDS